MKPLSALLIIDMQNDFLSPGGTFTKRHIKPQQLCLAIAWLAEAARQQQRQIVWITSHYGEIATSENLKGKTHLDKPCCVKDSWGSEIVDVLQSEFSKKNKNTAHVIKHWYDAFEQTDLHQWLQKRNITNLSLCGVTTNICISHTAQTALKLGYRVEILEGATSASTQNNHVKAVRIAIKVGCNKQTLGKIASRRSAYTHSSSCRV